jgi:hypothetical protein
MTVDNTRLNNKNLCLNCKGKNWLIQCECGTCEEIVTRYHNNGTYRRYAYNHHFRLAKNKRNQLGENNSKWSGGEYFHRKEGYWYIKSHGHPNAMKDGYVRKHVYNFTVREGQLFCCMLKWGIVHHKNGVKDDNDIDNLEGMMRSKHHSHHHKGKLGRKKNFGGRICLLCNSNKTTIDKKQNCEMWYKYHEGFICQRCYQKK